MDTLPEVDARLDKLCKLNVIEQIGSVGETSIVQEAWLRGQDLTADGWIYHISDGIPRDAGITIANVENMEDLRVKTLAKCKDVKIKKTRNVK